MKNLGFRLALICALSLSCGSAWAGNEVGNGGAAWVCRNAEHQIAWLTLVDLFEAKVEFGLTVTDTAAESAQDQITGAVSRLGLANPQFGQLLQPELSVVLGAKQVIQGGVLSVINDAFYHVAPSAEACPGGAITYEQVANFTNDGRLLISGDLWSKLTPTGQAALYVHEAVYKLLRDKAGDVNSIHTRQIVGRAFSTANPSSYAAVVTLSGIPGQGDCWQVRASFNEVPGHEITLSDYSSGFAVYQEQGSSTGYLDTQGSLALSGIEGDPFSENLAGARVRGADGNYRCGFINPHGDWTIPATEACFLGEPGGPFENGLAYIEIYRAETLSNDLRVSHVGQVIDTSGNVVLDSVVDPIGAGTRIIDARLGPSLFLATTLTSDGHAQSGIVDLSGNWVLRPDPKLRLDNVDTGATLDQPMPVSVYVAGNSDASGNEYLDLVTGKVVYGPLGGYTGGGPYFRNFSEGLGSVHYPDHTLYVDSTGNTVLTLVSPDAGDFKCGVARASNANGFYGYVDKLGTWTIPASFDQALEFSEKAASVEQNGSWGLIDRTGQWVIPPQFAELGSLHEGMITFSTSHSVGVIAVNAECVTASKIMDAGAVVYSKRTEVNRMSENGSGLRRLGRLLRQERASEPGAAASQTPR